MKRKNEELDKIKPEKVTLRIKGKDREIKFGFSAWAKLEKEYGGIKNIDKMQKEVEENPFTVIPHLIWIALLDKDDLDEETFLDEYELSDINMISDVFSRAMYGSLPKNEKGKKAVVEA